jgi:hypothetical protein
VTIAPVQRVSKPFSGVTSCPIGSGDGWATPTSGNLIVLTINADQVCSTPAGYTAGPSVVDDNAVYLFWKISAGNETTPTITPGGTTTAVMTACEYSGVAASPTDGSNTSSIVNSVGTTTTSTSVTTTAAADLIIAVAGLAHYSAGVAAPTSPTWTNSFVNQVTVDVGASTSNHASTFYAELAAGAAGTYSTSCSWTTGMLERQELLFAVQAAATVAVFPPYLQGRRRFVPPRYARPLPREATPVRAQVNPPYPSAGVKHPLRLRGLLPNRPSSVTPVSAQVIVAPPAYPPAGVKRPGRLRALLPRRARTAQPVPAQVVVQPPTFVSQALRFRVKPYIARRGHVISPPTEQRPAPPLARVKLRLARIFRGEARQIVPAQVDSGPVTPAQNATSAPAALAQRTSTSDVGPSTTSSAASVAPSGTSTPSVSDG